MDGIKVTISPAERIGVAVENRDGRLPYYDGEYTVTPVPEDDITLFTADRSMRNNITVEKIPTYTVGNPSGGNTFIIGGTAWQAM